MYCRTRIEGAERRAHVEVLYSIAIVTAPRARDINLLYGAHKESGVTERCAAIGDRGCVARIATYLHRNTLDVRTWTPMSIPSDQVSDGGTLA